MSQRERRQGRAWRVGIIIAGVILFGDVLLSLFLFPLVRVRETRLELPERGTYRCEELDMELIFSGRDIRGVFPDGNVGPLYSDMGAQISCTAADGRPYFRAEYRWDQKKDTIALDLGVYGYEPTRSGETFTFVRTAPDADEPNRPA